MVRLRAILTLVVLVGAIGVLVPAGAGAEVTPPTLSCGNRFFVNWKHGSAMFVRVHEITCARAKTVIAYALDHGLVKPSPHYRDLAWVRAHGYFVQRRRRVLGFTFTLHQPNTESNVVARRGGALLSFQFCWNNVNC